MIAIDRLAELADGFADLSPPLVPRPREFLPAFAGAHRGDLRTQGTLDRFDEDVRDFAARVSGYRFRPLVGGRRERQGDLVGHEGCFSSVWLGPEALPRRATADALHFSPLSPSWRRP